ncbi:S-adenosyl-L-methionine-dependent methyltransferase [Acephala macrosclerotiorum]|nr:S-adenosyl-L-methionine-dependent methyltransferase [Acephala macrosclerotiorum]
MPTPNTNNDRFNAEAVAWDLNPNVQLASSKALQSIITHIPELKFNCKDFDVLEIDCAQGMIDAFNIKLTKQFEINNIFPVCALLEHQDDVRIRLDPLNRGEAQGTDLPPRRFDLIISHLVLHHIPSLPEIFKTMHGCLNPGGRIVLIDFEDFGPEARRFHPEAKMQGVERHGIPREGARGMLKEAGFVDVRIETAFEMEKYVEATPGAGVVKGEGGTKMEFPFLICLGRKE